MSTSHVYARVAGAGAGLIVAGLIGGGFAAHVSNAALAGIGLASAFIGAALGAIVGSR